MSDSLEIRLAAGSSPTFGVDDLACAAATDLGFWNDEGLNMTWTPVHGDRQVGGHSMASGVPSKPSQASPRWRRMVGAISTGELGASIRFPRPKPLPRTNRNGCCS